MEYQLAKQLKDRGFKQEIKAGDKYYVFTSHPRMGIPPQWALHTSFIDLKDILGQKDWIKIPSLLELINACGKDFTELSKINENSWRCVKWIKYIYKCSDGESRYGCLWKELSWGKTPEEAVALLWLKLNKK